MISELFQILISLLFGSLWCKMPFKSSWGAVRQGNCRQCSLCAGHSGWQGWQGQSCGLRTLLSCYDVPYSRRRNAGLLTFFHRTNYGRFKPVNNALISIVIGSVFVARWVAICSGIGWSLLCRESVSVMGAQRIKKLNNWFNLVTIITEYWLWPFWKGI
jgi:hypothetical protein